MRHRSIRLAALLALAALTLAAPAVASPQVEVEPGVVLTPDADPDQFLPPSEAVKVKKLKEKDAGLDATRVAMASSCSNLVIQNTVGNSWGAYGTHHTQLYWCFNYATVTYCFRDRAVEGSRIWVFEGWIGWLTGGGAGAQYCRVKSQAHWKLPRPGLPDVHKYPWEDLYGYASGAYNYSRGGT